MSYMLAMETVQFGDPVAFLIPVKAAYFSYHFPRVLPTRQP